MSWRGYPKKNVNGNETRMGNQTSVCNLSHSHRSKLEAAVCQMLFLRMVAGEIQSIEVEQHVRVCGPPGHECNSSEKVDYIVDFKCTLPDGSILWVEAKGFRTAVYSIKRRLWIHNKCGRLEVWGGDYHRLRLEEEIG